MRRWSVLLLAASLLASPVAAAAPAGRTAAPAAPATGKPDTAKERQWAREIEPLIFQGRAEWLKTASGTKFFAIYTPARGPVVRGGVILLHGMGANPDWADVIHPLRVGLADRGWATLSLQMPVLPNGAGPKDYIPLFPDVPARVQAGLAFLKAQKIAPVMLVGHSLGAAMGIWFLAHTPNSGIRAFVAIGMPGSSDPKSPLDTAAALAKVRIPVLDLYGSRDFATVLSALPRRAAAARAAGDRNYQQVEIDGAGHFFRDMNGPLVTRVSTWLYRFGLKGPAPGGP